MYQTVGHTAIQAYAEAMQRPLYRREIQGDTLCQGLSYDFEAGDEVEDLFQLLHKIKVSLLLVFTYFMLCTLYRYYSLINI